jgi:flagellar L-ring protein precursor FlgH
MPGAPMGIEMPSIRWILVSLCASGALLAATKKPKPPELTPLDRYIQEANSRPRSQALQPSPGSLWSPDSRLTALGSDLRASQIDDMVTILVAESASAVAQGTTKTQRQSAVNSSITAAGGVPRATGALKNLAGATTQSQLDGQGATSRSTQLDTTLSARIAHVLPNGYLVVEGSKEVVVNSERQVVTVRGIIRPVDLSTGNIVRSDQIAQLELKVNGKGVVGDAVRRPFILYRLLLGLLPF